MLDILSQGRLGLGIGRGAYAHEYAAFGQSKEESQGRFAEAWEIIKMAWGGEEVNFEGLFYQVKGVKLSVQPLQKPLPRHWFAAMSAASYAERGRAGEAVIGMPYLSAKSFEMMGELAGQYHQNYLEAGHDPAKYDLPLVFHTHLATSEGEAHEIALPALQRFTSYQHPGHDHEAVKALHERQQLFIGTPEQIIALIEKYRATTGSQHFIFWMDFGAIEPKFVRRSMELMAKEVIPYFQGK
jgi:alkanesulfonate monooxygenase SsuD/methylene tetrahydromethanopterin reductase-like flavin-dependent oxidoreductase (luciferase family)